MSDFPTLDEILPKFVEVLSKHNKINRQQLSNYIAQKLNLTEEQLQLHTKNNISFLIHRLGLCDGLLSRAGFIDKIKSPDSNLEDSFLLTFLGKKQARDNLEDLTVRYLHTFINSKVMHGSGAYDTQSEGELELSRCMETLSDDFTVIHSVRWNAHDTQRGSVGEADFLVIHPEYGVLIIEVKGGRIELRRENGRQFWYTTNFYGQTTQLKMDPVAQAERNRRNLNAWFENDSRTRHLKFAVFPVLAFPDSTVKDDLRPDCPKDIVIDQFRMENLETTLIQIYEYWHQHADFKNKYMDGKNAVAALVDLFIPQKQLSHNISKSFERERQRIDEVTRRQFHILQTLQQYRRAWIVGGAGTGKTMLAMEKASQLYTAGFRVLFLTFNVGINQWIRNQLPEQIEVMRFHSFVHSMLRHASLESNKQYEDDDLADVLLEALQIVREESPEVLFDAIIIDEAQDFQPTWWIPIPDALKSPKHGILYIFSDDNQTLYTDNTDIPIDLPPLYLVQNCRNTKAIHKQLETYTTISSDSFCDGPDGQSVSVIPADTEHKKKKALQQLLHQLIVEGGVDCADIILLTPIKKDSIWQTGEKLGNFELSWDLTNKLNNTIRVSTIQSFKGLETAIVILSELDKGYTPTLNQLVYVGLSRARNRAYVIGQLPQPVSV